MKEQEADPFFTVELRIKPIDSDDISAISLEIQAYGDLTKPDFLEKFCEFMGQYLKEQKA